MHKLLLACYFVCAFSLVNAQEVVATQGDTYSNATGTIDFTIGEMVINTVTFTAMQRLYRVKNQKTPPICIFVRAYGPIMVGQFH